MQYERERGKCGVESGVALNINANNNNGKGHVLVVVVVVAECQYDGKRE